MAAGVAAVALPVALVNPAAQARTTSTAVGSDAARSTHPQMPKEAVVTGWGGAVSSVDRDASQVGIDVLRDGGTAADAAVATAAALGVTEPYSAGIGGGGFLVYYDAKTKKVSTIDGRETAPKSFTDKSFTNPDGTAMSFSTVVSSGLSIGVPGTPALWANAVREHGKMSFKQVLAPAEKLARTGFVVDQTFADQTAANAARFSMFPATARVFLRGGAAPAVGSVFRNPDLSRAYQVLANQGVKTVYNGQIGNAIVAEARRPHTAPGVTVMGGQVTRADLRRYTAPNRAPIASSYQGLDVYGMPVPSSGGIAIAEILGLMKAYEQKTGVRHQQAERRRLPAPVLGGVSHRLRRPQPLRRRRRGGAGQGAHQPEVRQGAGLRVQPHLHPGQADPVRVARRKVQRLQRNGCRSAGALRGHVHDAPDDRRQVGQRGLLHLDHRADRRLGHHRPRLRVPAQQRAHRLQLHPTDSRVCPTRTCPARASGRARR